MSNKEHHKNKIKSRTQQLRAKIFIPIETFSVHQSHRRCLKSSIYSARFYGMKYMNLKKTSKNTRHILASSLSSVIVTALLTGCGGTPIGNVADSAGNPQAPVTVSQQASSSRPATNTGSLASSFTLNSTENLKGFNPEIWNGPKSWYECNCGDDQPKPPKTMPWNSAG
jgi:hypothetical protein